MDLNPYESSALPSESAQRLRVRRTAVCVFGWCVCFLIPSFLVVLTQYFPALAATQWPLADGMLGRMSLTMNARADVALPLSFVGCALFATLWPVRNPWKLGIVVVWFPLSLVQAFAIIMGLYYATGFMYT